MSDHGNGDAAPPTEHLNIKVTDNNNEVFFKIKRNTRLEKLMRAFCDRQGKKMESVRFLFEGARVQAEDTPDTVLLTWAAYLYLRETKLIFILTVGDARRRHVGGTPGTDRRLLSVRHSIYLFWKRWGGGVRGLHFLALWLRKVICSFRLNLSI